MFNANLLNMENQFTVIYAEKMGFQKKENGKDMNKKLIEMSKIKKEH